MPLLNQLNNVAFLGGTYSAGDHDVDLISDLHQQISKVFLSLNFGQGIPSNYKRRLGFIQTQFLCKITQELLNFRLPVKFAGKDLHGALEQSRREANIDSCFDFVPCEDPQDDSGLS